MSARAQVAINEEALQESQAKSEAHGEVAADNHIRSGSFQGERYS